MKAFIQLIITSLCVLFISFSSSYAEGDERSSIFSDDKTVVVPYCSGDEECSLSGGINLIKEAQIDEIITDYSFSQYIQQIVVYLLGFITLIAVIYIIYAGFRVLISGGDEEQLKTSKKTILYVIIGILIIWFAWSITTFITGLGDNAIKSSGSSGSASSYTSSSEIVSGFGESRTTDSDLLLRGYSLYSSSQITESEYDDIVYAYGSSSFYVPTSGGVKCSDMRTERECEDIMLCRWGSDSICKNRLGG